MGSEMCIRDRRRAAGARRADRRRVPHRQPDLLLHGPERDGPKLDGTERMIPFGETWPALNAFTVLAQGRRVIPVVRRVLADGETPLGVYRKLAADRPGTFLLESAENGRSWSRWSFIGAGAPSALTIRGDEAVWLGTAPKGCLLYTSPSPRDLSTSRMPSSA